MDVVGVAMGLATVPMALLLVACLPAGILLIVAGSGDIVLFGLLAIGIGVVVAALLEQIVIGCEAVLIARIERGRPRRWRSGLPTGILPMIVVLGWEYGCFVLMPHDPAHPLLSWQWAYGAATGPWTLFALFVEDDRRTLCSIRAYAGHVAYWLLSLAVLAGAPDAAAIALMAPPAILPIVVGALLAVADRDALRNVRI